MIVENVNGYGKQMSDEIIQKIKNIIVENPKNYSKIIKKHSDLYNWVLENKKTDNEKVSAQIYSAIHSISDVCKYNKVKKFDRWSSGFVGCGPASVCDCTKENISSSVTNTKSKLTLDDIEQSNNKRIKTMNEKYGVSYNSQRAEVKPILKKSKLSNTTHKILSDYDWLYTEYETKKRTSVDIAKQLDVHNSTVIEYLKKNDFQIRQYSNYSLEELEIQDFLKSLGIDFIENDRTVLDGKELDIYIPNKNIAFEINGLYWHSYGKADIEKTDFHLYKTEKCQEKSISLLHITDWEWNNKNDIIKSIIKTKLGLNKRIPARKCVLKQIDTKDAKTFFEENHLQGFIGATNYIGLIYDNDLVMCMSFGKNRFGEGVELYRLASKQGITVIGGASKIIKYYTKTYNINNITTYCDYSKSYGNGYRKMGFTYMGKTKVNYFWTDKRSIIPRYKTQHSNIKKIIGDLYDPNLSERENMMNAGFRRYWGCGNLIFKYNKISDK
jgi:G:T-mismatch repair DNA endonuclease (very short patch repair protein)